MTAPVSVFGAMAKAEDVTSGKLRGVVGKFERVRSYAASCS